MRREKLVTTSILGIAGALSLFRASREISFSQIIAGKKIVVAKPPAGFAPDELVALGAQGVLVLDAEYHASDSLAGPLVRKRLARIKDVHANNCEIAILHGATSSILSKKHKFHRFQSILIPSGLPMLGAAIGLLRYGRRGDLVHAGQTRICVGDRDAVYSIFHVASRSRELRRQYAPTAWTPLEIVRSISDLNLVVLRGAGNIAAGQHSGDIDILIASHDLHALEERFDAHIGTYPVDVYTDDGSADHTHNAAPYYAQNVAKRMLKSAVLDSAGIKVCSRDWQFISYCYHVLFHGKLIAGAEKGTLTRQSFRKADSFDELKRLAHLAGKPPPRSVNDIEILLKEYDALPSLDLVGFYSHNDPFLTKRYFDQSVAPPGLVTFFLRDFGRGLADVETVRKQLETVFEIRAEGPVTDSMREAVQRGVRGGNWTDPDAYGGTAEPVYWFVCWDAAPKPPSRRTRRKHPRVDNENVRVKDLIRSAIGSSGTPVRGLLHSSDNTREALDHLQALGIDSDSDLVGFLKSQGILVAKTKQASDFR